ncbi:MFS transporter [Kiloniella majae]|uniref:MFS transporter n=1 Tax=Kiloniella majae TaxID=1938558 RepID=UPI000A278F06|nr:MFS transporter [Kiloniella majae]
MSEGRRIIGSLKELLSQVLGCLSSFNGNYILGGVYRKAQQEYLEMQSLSRSRNLYLLVLSNFMTSIGQGVALIATPWFLINADNGSAVFGGVAFVVNLFIFFTAPWFGVFIDRHSRKGMMITIRIILVFLLLVLFGLSELEQNKSFLMAGYFALGSLFFILNQSARSAFIQEAFEPVDYTKVNAIMEVEGQAAAVVTGAIAAVMLRHWSLQEIILLNLVTIFVSLVAISVVSHQRKPDACNNETSFITEFMVGLRYLLKYPRLTIFVISSATPYNCVQTGNYLIPIILIVLLSEGAETLALYEIIFGLGAVVAGLVYSILFSTRSPIQVILFNMCIFSVVLVAQTFSPNLFTVVWLALFLGVANSSIRIARNNWLMAVVDPFVFGRMMTTIPSLFLGMKAALIGIVVWVVNNWGPHAGIGTLCAFQLLSHCIAWWSYRTGLQQNAVSQNFPQEA